MEAEERSGDGCRRSALRFRPGPATIATCRPVALRLVAAASRLRPPVQLPRPAPLGGYECLQGVEEPLPGAAVRQAREPAHYDRVHSSGRRGTVRGRPKPALLNR